MQLWTQNKIGENLDKNLLLNKAYLRLNCSRFELHKKILVTMVPSEADHKAVLDVKTSQK